MTDKRAMEILDPDHLEHYESIEPIIEACRIGMEAIRKVKELRDENDSLKKRLENATDLPCNVGDRFYIVEYYPPEIIEEECCDFSFREFPKILLENGFDCTYELGDNGSYFVTFDKNEAKKIFEKLKKEQKND